MPPCPYAAAAKPDRVIAAMPPAVAPMPPAIARVREIQSSRQQGEMHGTGRGEQGALP